MLAPQGGPGGPMGPGAFPPPFGFGGMYLYHCEEGVGLVPYFFFEIFLFLFKKV